jgi:hypothetical protein
MTEGDRHRRQRFMSTPSEFLYRYARDEFHDKYAREAMLRVSQSGMK